MAIDPRVGRAVLGISAFGYPLTRVVRRRCGRGGAVFLEALCAGFAVRDAVLVGQGAPGRLRRLPGVLLYAELGVAVAAALALVPSVVRGGPGDAASAGEPAEALGQVALATLFALHTIRFGIYLRPDQGRRLPGASLHP